MRRACSSARHISTFSDGMAFAAQIAVLAKHESERTRAISPLPKRGLQIDEDLEFQHREWNAQRMGWVVMAVIVVAALLGVFGTGPVSSSSAQRDGLGLEYERFGRLQQPTTLRFQFSAEPQEAARLFISRKYIESVQVEHITPQPQKVESDANWLIYYFLARENPAAATFHLKHDKFGPLSGKARLVQGDPISFSQFIYP